jgi:prephenate dehydratase
MKNKKKVYTLGPEGSFHHLSCKEYLGGESEIEFCKSFGGIFEAVKAGNLGWIAIYNSNTGLIENHENEINRNYNQLDEMDYEVHLCIAGIKKTNLNDIDKIYSHEKAISQSKRFINEKLSGVELISCSSTSEAAQKLANENIEKAGAICHAETAQFYNLEILAQIPNKRKNETTFSFFA